MLAYERIETVEAAKTPASLHFFPINSNVEVHYGRNTPKQTA